MALIIDANRSGDFTHPRTVQADEIVSRVSSKRLRICLGGKLTRELSKTKLSKLLMEWSRAGLVDRFSDNAVNSRAAEITATTVSDDEHVVALACVSGCRLVFTSDKDLISDFKNRILLSPRGKVITSSTATKYAIPLLERYGQ